MTKSKHNAPKRVKKPVRPTGCPTSKSTSAPMSNGMSNSTSKPGLDIQPPDRLPRWIGHHEIREASVPELLLYFAAGPEGDRSRDPLISIGERLSDELSELALCRDDLSASRETTLSLAQRVEAFVELMKRAHPCPLLPAP